MGLWVSEMWVGEMGRRSREEMREALEREKNGKEKKKKGEKPEREEERKRENIFFNERRERSLINFFFSFLLQCIAMHSYLWLCIVARS